MNALRLVAVHVELLRLAFTSQDGEKSTVLDKKVNDAVKQLDDATQKFDEHVAKRLAKVFKDSGHEAMWS
jgi:cell shape-determining protein MreC